MSENYSDQMMARMRIVYDPADTEEQRNAQVQQLADEFGKKARSIRQKLVHMNLYVSKKPVSKVTGEKPASKENLVETLAKITDAPTGKLETLAKANKTAIQFLIETYRDLTSQYADMADALGTFDDEPEVDPIDEQEPVTTE